MEKPLARRLGPAVLLLGCFALLTGLLCGWRHGAPLPVERALAAWSAAHRPPAAAAAARGITDSGTGPWAYVLTAAAGWVAARARGALAALLVLLAGQALRHGLMELLHRPRPPRTDWAAHASGWSFPSGHSTTSALVAGLLWLALRRAGAGRGWCALPLAWAACVGLTRIYLGVHWAGDVLGGWLLAAGWLGLLGRLVPAVACGRSDP